MNSETGKWVITIGALLVLAGLIIYFFHDKLHWIGRLPGDIHIEKDNFSFYFPITTMIIFSVALSFIVQLIKRIC
jgi:formate hydrogenlyase subunit 3/multisubunit Na+/H+ antiporter MnhD subunit